MKAIPRLPCFEVLMDCVAYKHFHVMDHLAARA